MNTPTTENRYCPCALSSTRHDRRGQSLVCQRCGSVKYPVTFIRQAMGQRELGTATATTGVVGVRLPFAARGVTADEADSL